jgi:hypothetical protein
MAKQKQPTAMGRQQGNRWW